MQIFHTHAYCEGTNCHELRASPQMLHVQRELILISPFGSSVSDFSEKKLVPSLDAGTKKLLPAMLLMAWWLDLMIIYTFFNLHSSVSLFPSLLCRCVTVGNVTIDSHVLSIPIDCSAVEAAATDSELLT